MNQKDTWRASFSILIALICIDCIPQYYTHLHSSENIDPETMSLIFVKSDLFTLSLDGEEIDEQGKGEYYEVFKVKPGSHTMKLKYYSYNEHRTGTVTRTGGPWNKSIDVKPGYIYLITHHYGPSGMDFGRKHQDQYARVNEVGPISTTSSDGNYQISLITPDLYGDAKFKYSIINSKTLEEKTYPMFQSGGGFTILYSPDKKRIAIGSFSQNDKRFYVVDGIEETAYESVKSPLFNPTGSKFIYLARKRDNEWYVVTNGIEGEPYKYLFSPFFSADGKTFAYIIIKKRKRYLVTNGIESEPYDAIWKIESSPNGERMGYITINNDKYSAVIDGVKSISYDRITGIYFSENSASVAFPAKKGRKELMAINGIEGPLYDEVNFHTFSLDGKKYSYEAKTKRKWHVVINGSPGKAYDEVWKTSFSPDGERYGYLARTGKRFFVVIDGEESEVNSSNDMPDLTQDE